MIQFQINGVEVLARQYIGIGSLGIETGRGELKAHSRDFIIEFPSEIKIVLSESIFLSICPQPTESQEKTDAKQAENPDEEDPNAAFLQ